MCWLAGEVVVVKLLLKLAGIQCDCKNSHLKKCWGFFYKELATSFPPAPVVEENPPKP